MLSDKTEKLFEDMGVYSKREGHARHDILLENYYKKLQIEARVMGEMVNNVIHSCCSFLSNRLDRKM